KALADEGIHALYASDLSRAAETAEAVARVIDVPMVVDEGLRERHFGRLEGLTHDEIAAQWPEDARRWRGRDPLYGPAGGETLASFYDRCVGTLARLASRHPGQTVAIVAHGGVLDCFYRAANRVSLEEPRAWKITNASINRLLYTPEGFSLVAWADCRHLEGDDDLDEATDGVVAPA
ncbi:MAG: histidine phosphatase family protein, partial [Burkholderiales bacterium]|nr:histidine phosphatase family protein [Burkholderiales bacterium]